MLNTEQRNLITELENVMLKLGYIKANVMSLKLEERALTYPHRKGTAPESIISRVTQVEALLEMAEDKQGKLQTKANQLEEKFRDIYRKGFGC